MAKVVERANQPLAANDPLFGRMEDQIAAAFVIVIGLEGVEVLLMGILKSSSLLGSSCTS
jgi:hypothetical protein